MNCGEGVSQIDIEYQTFPNDGEEEHLTRATLAVRSQRPSVSKFSACMVYEFGKMAQIWINTISCRFSAEGWCTICDYWDGAFSDDSIDAVESFVKNNGHRFDAILLNTCGSCLCDEELSFTTLEHILYIIAKSSINRIILETHLAYVTEEKIKRITYILAGREIIIEYGQESTSDKVLKFCLNKPSMINEYKIIPKLRELGVKVLANIVLGVPFLSVERRISDSVESIRTILRNGADGVILFPVNIKPYTLIRLLYDAGLYKRVSALEIAEVLGHFTSDVLERVSIAWFEPEREIIVPYSEIGLGPQYCDGCSKTVLQLLYDYNETTEGYIKKNIIGKMLGVSCACKDNLYKYDILDIHVCYAYLKNLFSKE